mgnify:CR=1 FL=1
MANSHVARLDRWLVGTRLQWFGRQIWRAYVAAILSPGVVVARGTWGVPTSTTTVRVPRARAALHPFAESSYIAGSVCAV